MQKLLVAFALLALIACGPPPPQPPEFASGTLSGVVDGADWTFASGGTNAFLSDEEGFFTSFYGAAQGDVCALAGDSDLLTSLPVPVARNCEVAEDCRDFRACEAGACVGPPITRFGFRNNVTFLAEDEDGTPINNVATSGAVRIDEVDEDAGIIRGALKARFDADNDVDGEFEVTICPE